MFIIVGSYCECFAAGIYCVDSCACENCYNKPEFEDTVMDTRQQIESRNPLAFAPKVVKHATDSPANVKVTLLKAISPPYVLLKYTSLSLRTLYRRKVTGRHPPQLGIKEVATARSQNV